MSIRTRVSILLSVLFVINALVVVVDYIYLSSTKAAPVVINVAGRQRMLSQKISKEIFAMAMATDEEHWQVFTKDKKYWEKSLKASYILFDKSLNALLDGGKTYAKLSLKGEFILPGTKNPKIRKQLLDVKSKWQELQKAVSIVLHPGADREEIEKAVSIVRKISIPLLVSMDKAVRMFQDEADEIMAKQRNFKIISSVFFAVVFFFVYFNLLYNIRIKLIGGVEKITSLLEKLSKGDFREEYETKTIKCSAITGCGNKECPYFKTGSDKCFVIHGSFAYGEKQNTAPLIQQGKVESCDKCKVYKMQTTYEIDKVGIMINKVILSLRKLITKMGEVSHELLNGADRLRRASNNLEKSVHMQSSSVRNVIQEVHEHMGKLGEDIRTLSQRISSEIDRANTVLKEVDDLSMMADLVVLTVYGKLPPTGVNAWVGFFATLTFLGLFASLPMVTKADAKARGAI
jgi:methyl-accepting chemotaxis protein